MMIQAKFASGLCALLLLSGNNVAHADIVGPYGWQNWQAAVAGQSVTTMRLNDLMVGSGFVVGQEVPGDAFAAQFGATFESSSTFIRGSAAQSNALVVQSTGAAASIRWNTLVSAVYYIASGQQEISFYSGDSLLQTVNSPFSETGFTSIAGFDRMVFHTRTDRNLELLRFRWVIPSPAVSALFFLCGAAAPGRRRRV